MLALRVCLLALCGLAAALSPNGQPMCINQFTDRVNGNISEAFLYSHNVTTIPSTDVRYDELRRHSDNLKILANVAYIVTPKTAQDVADILTKAAKYGIRPTIRSGGHCYEDFWSENPGGVLLDLARLNKVERDANGVIWAGPGRRMGPLYEALYKEFGLTVPGASGMGVGLGGQVTGAGYGFLSRKYGLVIDYVDQLEVVHMKDGKTGQVITVSNTSASPEERNLFWAMLGGGCQNFGVVTNIGFKDLPVSPPLMHYNEAILKLKTDATEAQFLDYIEKYTKFFVANSDVNSEFCDMFVNMELIAEKGGARIRLQIFTIGDKAYLFDKFLDQVGFPKNKFVCKSMSYYQLIYTNGFYDDAKTRGDFYTHTSAYMVSAMPKHQIQTLWKYLTADRSSDIFYAFVQIRGYGCAVSKKSESDTAYPHRTAKIKMQYGVHWQHANESQYHDQWLQDLYGEMYGAMGPKPDDTMDGCFVNYPNRKLIDWQHLYYKNNYERLRQVKKQWDPYNVFRHRHSIEAA